MVNRLFHKQRKSFITLIETLIAMTLLSVLLTIIFGFFREISTLSQTTEQKQKESFQMRYVESRLSYIFERVVNENSKSRTFFFYTQPPNSDFSKSTSVIFTFDNGIRKDPLFSGDILARLYLDNEKTSDSTHDQTYRLTLAMWPLHVDNPQEYMRKEILLEGVKNIQFEFYAPPEKITNEKALPTNNVFQTPPTGGINPNLPNQEGQQVIETQPERDMWHLEWPITHNQMPSIIKMTVEVQNSQNLLERTKNSSKDTHSLIFTFVLPSSKNPIHYPADAVP